MSPLQYQHGASVAPAQDVDRRVHRRRRLCSPGFGEPLALVSRESTVTGTPAHWAWMVAFFLIYTTGELFILPTGLALFGRIAPRTLAATVMAFWFSGSFAGNLFAGGVGTLWNRLHDVAFFSLTATLVAVAGAMLLAIERPAHALLREHA